MKVVCSAVLLTVLVGCTVAQNEIVLDFQGYSKGQVLNGYLGNGIALDCLMKKNGNWIAGEAMIFDSSNPSGGGTLK